MLRTITLFAAFYWMTVFAMLAIAAANGSGADSAFALLLSGAADAGLAHPSAMPKLATAFALGFAVIAVLFLWTFVTVLFESVVDDSDSVVRAAFGSAAGMLTVLLLAGATDPAAGAIPALSLQLAALMGSYAAIHAEKRAVTTAADRIAMDDVRAAAKMMAQGAAHNTLLTRFSGRTTQAKEGGSR